MEVTKELLNELFAYEDGHLYRRKIVARAWRNLVDRAIGSRAGSVGSTGRMSTSVFGKLQLNHRLIWIMHFGSIACDMEMDHIDRDFTNNRIENLRLVNRFQNVHNRSKVCGKSKFKGVWFHKKKQKFESAIVCKRKRIHLGTFDKEEDAARAYNEAARKYHGAFAVLNEVNRG